MTSDVGVIGVTRLMRTATSNASFCTARLRSSGFGSAPGSDGPSACCNEKPGPNLVPPDTPGGLTPGPGGGRVGAVLVSPCIRPGTVDTTPYNHYSLLRSVERNWHLPFLGYAGQQGLAPLGPQALNQPGC